MSLSVSEMPSELRSAFGEYGPCVSDGWSGETIGWGHPIIRWLGETQWAAAGNMESWYTVASLESGSLLPNDSLLVTLLRSMEMSLK
jgi:hypothetical protein